MQPDLPAAALLAATLAVGAPLACKKEASKPPPAEAKPADDGYDYAAMVADPVADEASALSEGPLAQRAASDAPGRAFVGDLIAGSLSPGEEIDQEFTIDPARCYTLIAVGGEGVVEVEAAITTVAPVRGGETTLAEDAERGAVAVIGGGEACYRGGETRTPARFVLRVSEGAGVVVGQLYASEAPPVD